MSAHYALGEIRLGKVVVRLTVFYDVYIGFFGKEWTFRFANEEACRLIAWAFLAYAAYIPRQIRILVELQLENLLVVGARRAIRRDPSRRRLPPRRSLST